jgi:mRNA interferase MazF
MKRGEVWLLILDPTKGSEQKGMRPSVIVSPDSMNESLDTKVIIPLTTKFKSWPSRVLTEFNSQKGQAMCEQIRTVSSKRLNQKIGELSDGEIVEIISTIGALYGII